MAQKRLTNAQIIAALKAKAGNIAEVARALGVDRSTIYKRIEDSTELQQVCTDARERLADIAETMLLKRVTDGDTTAIIFALKTQGKKRGYVEKLEIDVKYVSLIQQLEALVREHGDELSDVFNAIIAAYHRSSHEPEVITLPARTDE